MGYYCAWGDAKTMYSSEDEDYEDSISGIRNKRNHVSGSLGGTSTVTTPSILDDTDRQFWAEDELSNAESRQRLAARRKRRHSLSYRNRTINRNRSGVSYFLISTSDSIHAATSSKVRRTHYRCQSKSKRGNLQSTNIGRTLHTFINEMSCTTKKMISSGCQTATITDQKSSDSCFSNQRRILHNEHHEQMSDNTIKNVRKARLKRTHTLAKRK